MRKERSIPAVCLIVPGTHDHPTLADHHPDRNKAMVTPADIEVLRRFESGQRCRRKTSSHGVRNETISQRKFFQVLSLRPYAHNPPFWNDHLPPSVFNVFVLLLWARSAGASLH